MIQRTFLDYLGLKRFLSHLKTIIPTKTSELQNDSGYLTQHNPVDSSLSETSENAVQNKVVKGALDGKSDTGHTHTASEVSGLSTVATSGSYNDLSNTPTIPTVNNAKLTIQRNGTTVKTFTANASSNVTANITVPTAVSELTNDSGYLTSASSLDSSKLTGTIDIARLPKGALERLVTVANQTARFALTANDVQLGDTVKQLDTGVMYIVTDESKLSSADGYTEYTAGSATSVPWSGVTGKPSSFTPSSHTHGNVTNDGKLPTASRALISDSSKKIAVSTVTATELGYLSGVTSAIQTQLNGKATSNHVHGNITNDGKVGTTANKPLITGTGGVVQAGSFGTAANTFCEGNDARLSDARTPVAHTHTKSDVTDLFNSANTWAKSNQFTGYIDRKSTSYEIGNTPASDVYLPIRFTDKNNDSIGWVRSYVTTSGATATEIATSNKFKNNALDPTGTQTYQILKVGIDNTGSAYHQFAGKLKQSELPFTTDAYDLGSSSYQWNNLYAKNYFYNGTQWGLDQANTWTAQNSFNSDLNLNYASTDVDDIVNSVAGSATLDNFVHMTGNETVNGIKSFPDGVIANVTGSATSATNDGSGNVISTTYGKLGANNTWSGRQTYKDFAILYNSSKLPATLGQLPSENINPLRQYIGYATNYDSSYFIHDTQISTDGILFYRWTIFSIDHSDNTGMWLQIDPTSQDLTKKLIVKASVLPHQTNTYNLGKSDLQWNNVYAKNYYYNGTQWGLDQANVWNTYQTINGYQFGNEKSPNGRTCLYLTSNRDTVGQSGIYITKFRQNRAQGAMNPADLQFISFDVLENSIRTNSALQLNITNWNEDGDVPSGAVLFSNLSNAQLGSSLAPWKALNGVNPGALSLPNLNYSDTKQWIDISGNITDETGAGNEYDPAVDGWVVIFAKDNPTFLRVNVHAPRPTIKKYLSTATGVAAPDGSMVVSVPAPANSRVYIYFNKGSGSLESATFITCQGNV